MSPGGTAGVASGVPAKLVVVDAGTVAYGAALAWQNDLHRRRVAGEIGDVVLLLEHPHVYTLGRRFSAEHLLLDRAGLARRGIEVFEADRGGSITYHGPGQLVGYPIVALADPANSPERSSNRGPDAIAYLRALEETLIRAVAPFGVDAGRREGLTGVWVGEEKLASIGVNVSRGVTKHGFALNVHTDLSFFAGMVPCGIQAVRLTSLEALLGQAPPMEEVRDLVVRHLAEVLGARAGWATVEGLGLSASAPVEPPAASAAADSPGVGLLEVTMPPEAKMLSLAGPGGSVGRKRTHDGQS
jgi:lipoate-protein ligase B